MKGNALSGMSFMFLKVYTSLLAMSASHYIVTGHLRLYAAQHACRSCKCALKLIPARQITNTWMTTVFTRTHT
jgi:hypothetical protein